MKLNGKETIEEKIMVKDKRRFNEEGELREEAEFEGPENLDTGNEQASGKTAEVAELESTGVKSEAKPKSPEVIKLENELQQERARREAAEAKLLAVQAKAEELIKRMEKETAEMRERIKRSLEDRARESQFQFLKTLLPILDNLKLAIEHAENSEISPSSAENLLEGVKGTARAFEQALSNLGVEPIESIGADFTPELHEAVDTVEVEPEREGKVILEYQRGYKFGDKLLRPAKVQVGRGKK